MRAAALGADFGEGRDPKIVASGSVSGAEVPSYSLNIMQLC